MAKNEIPLKGLDGIVDELVMDTADGIVDGSFEDCVRMLFPQEGETTPRLRFKGFEGAWEKKLLSDCLEISDEKNSDNLFGVDDVLSVSDDFGVVNQIEHLGRSYAGKSVSGYKILRPGQIVYTKSPLKAKPYGIIKCNTGKAGIVSVLYAVYNPKEGVAPEFIHYYFDPAWRLNAYMRPLVNKGAKNTMNISDETALSGYIMIPKNIEEQRRIASFLMCLDTQHTFHYEQINRLKELKCGCLNELFQDESETLKSIRFKSCDNKWYRAKASDLFVTYNDRNRPDLPVLSACQDNRGMAIRSESGYDISHNSSNEVTYKVVKPGQFVIHLRSFQGGFAHSSVEGITSPAYTVFGFKDPDNHDDYFWKIVFMSKSFVKRLEAITYGIRDGRSISFEEFSEMTFSFPSYEEQHCIASFFKELDALISTQQQRLDRLTQMKQACLDLLFPDNQQITPPHLRFKGFEGQWTIVKLSALAKPYFVSNKLIHHQNLLSLSYGQIVRKDIQTKKGLLPASFDTYQIVQNGIIVFRFTDLQNDHKSLRVGLAKEEGIISPAYVCVKCENVLPDFLYLQLHTYDLRKVFYSMGDGMRQTLSYSDIKDMSMFVPSMEEQRRIVSLINSFDNQIAIQTQQVEKLKQLKEACLNQMIA